MSKAPSNTLKNEMGIGITQVQSFTEQKKRILVIILKKLSLVLTSSLLIKWSLKVIGCNL
jgi:hypothetical protein